MTKHERAVEALLDTAVSLGIEVDDQQAAALVSEVLGTVGVFHKDDPAVAVDIDALRLQADESLAYSMNMARWPTGNVRL